MELHMLEFLRRQMAALLEKRAGLQADMDKVLEVAEREKRTSLTEDESTRFAEIRSAITKLDDDEIKPLQARIAELEEDEKRNQAANALRAQYGQVNPDGGERRASVSVGAEPQVYGDGSGHSYFLDMARVDMNRGDGDGGPTAARERLARHAAELKVELPAREARRRQRAETEHRLAFGELRGGVNPFEKRVNPNRTDGQGGYFVPPLWLVDEFVALQRAGRVIANSIRNLTLPNGTDSINVPKVSTGTATAAQTADAASVQSTDMTDTTISAPVRTIAGQQDIAIQLLDQSPISFDEVIFADLIGDYNTKLDVQVIRGTGANGQVTGFTGVSSIIAVTYTDASPTVSELWPSFGKVLSQMTTTRFLPPTAWFMHPRRWYWGTAALDTTNRPLFQPSEAAPFNPMALQTGAEAEGPVGRIAGLPVLLDPNITTAAVGGAQTGGTEDEIYALRTPDHYLWEGSMRTRTLTEVLSGTLQVRLQVYNYVAYLGSRYASSTGKISDTGLAAPSGF
jgi:HK97 family phage major capsid protein